MSSQPPPLDHLSPADAEQVRAWDWAGIHRAERAMALERYKARIRAGMADWPRCRVCDKPMMLGQQDTHRVCAGKVPAAEAAQPRPAPLRPSQPQAFICPRCWRSVVERTYGPCAICRAQLREMGGPRG